jgi:hypothetical protein
VLRRPVELAAPKADIRSASLVQPGLSSLSFCKKWSWSHYPPDDPEDPEDVKYAEEEADNYQSVYARLKRVLSNDKAFEAVATPRVKDIREQLRRLRLLSESNAFRSSSCGKGSARR